jgi:hypothetical protein
MGALLKSSDPNSVPVTFYKPIKEVLNICISVVTVLLGLFRNPTVIHPPEDTCCVQL